MKIKFLNFKAFKVKYNYALTINFKIQIILQV